jgi:SH3-like domain-containing protein
LEFAVSPKRLAFLALALTSCGSNSARDAAIGEAYVAPRALELRREIDLRSPATATVKHGERLEIVQRRRRFFRVRTAGGAEGWTDYRMLLNGEEMAALQTIEQLASKLPSQGVATTFDLLNAHLEPFRQSPTILRLKEGERFEVLCYQTMPRVAPARKPLIPPPKPEPVVKKRREPRIPPPPLPPGPPPPPDWLELSKTRENPAIEPPPRAAVPLDDWALVRTQGGDTGWVLSSRLYMAIPDAVAQYAEGRRITSYFSLGEMRDGNETRHHWLWTTIGERNQPYDFDSFRVFIWNLRRHRYETAYIERNRIGHLPVIVKGSRFSVCLEKENGQRYRRTYELQVNIVRFLEEAPCGVLPSEQLVAKVEAGVEPAPEPAKPAAMTWKDRVRRWFR